MAFLLFSGSHLPNCRRRHGDCGLRAIHRIGPCPDKLMLPASICQKILPAQKMGMLAGIYPDFHLVDDYGLSPGSGIAVTEG